MGSGGWGCAPAQIHPPGYFPGMQGERLMRRAVRYVCAAGLCLSGVAAAASNVQFSAQVVQSAPDGRSRQATLYVGDNQVRMEHRRGDADMIEIYDMNAQRVLLLVPQQKTYMQRELPEGAAVNPMLPEDKRNPCSALADSSCKQMGSESLYGRSVSKWEVSVVRQGKTRHSLHWIDDERLMSLRDVWPDGSVTELKLAGIEKLDGRNTERWQKTTTYADDKQDTSTQWYDLELQIIIREELPGGFFRELKSIKVAPQPPALFRVPVDYKRADVPEPGQ